MMITCGSKLTWIKPKSIFQHIQQFPRKIKGKGFLRKAKKAQNLLIYPKIILDVSEKHEWKISGNELGFRQIVEIEIKMLW